MEYPVFLEKLKQNLKNKTEAGTQLVERTVKKNNAVVLDGLAFVRDGERISPVIYLNEYYQEYLKGASIETITFQILSLYRKRTRQEIPDLDAFMDWESASGRVVPRLINSKMNEEYLKEIPSRPFLNLSVIYAYILEGFEEGNASITVRNEHLRMWNISGEELDRAAFSNMDRLTPPFFAGLRDMLGEMMPGEMIPGEEFPETSGEEPMHVLTNRQKSFGAVWICRKDMLEKIRQELGRDFLVLPSSIHECMVLSDEQADRNYDEVASIVREINMTQVEANEVLADSVYRYSQQENELSICRE